MSIASKVVSELPQREKDMFNMLVTCYEKHNFTKGISVAEKILTSQPNHAETHAIKGIMLISEDKKVEGLAAIKKGIMCNMKSLVCWHIFGLYYRTEKNYLEAAKCFKRAIESDNKNLSVIRDLAHVQIMLRDYKGLMHTRRMQLAAGFTNVTNWLAYAIAAYLNQCYDLALLILNNFFAFTPIPEEPSYAYSEAIMFKVRILSEKGDYEQAYEYLTNSFKFIVDKTLFRELKARFLIKMKKMSDAKQVINELFVINSDNSVFHQLFLDANEITSTTNIPRAVSIYEKLVTKYPKSDYCKIRLFTYLDAKQLQTQLEAYLCSKIRKGVYGLCSVLYPLRKNEEKCKLIFSIAESFCQKVENKEIEEAPSTLLYCYAFIAQLYYSVKNYDKAMEMIDKAIKHTPTMLELYIIKAKVFKKLGDTKLASEMMTEARKLDLYDRYLNVRCVKYLIRNNQHEEALEIINLFMRDGEGDIQLQLREKQCSWFALERAEAYLRQGEFGLALKQFDSVEKSFLEKREDQMDFHFYSLRKVTLNAYIDMLLLCDKYEGKKNYLRALVGMTKCYLGIAGLSEEAKAKAREEKTEVDKKMDSIPDKKPIKLRGKTFPFDCDPTGLNYLLCESPKAEAMTSINKVYQLFNTYSSQENEKAFPKEEILTLAVRAFLENDKFVLALSALKKALTNYPESEKVKEMKTLFCERLDKAVDSLPAIVKAVLTEERKLL